MPTPKRGAKNGPDAGGNPNQNRKVVQANLNDRAELNNKTVRRIKQHSTPGKYSAPKGKMMGTNADQRGSGKLTGFDYGGSKSSGAWTNSNGAQVGHSYQEDSTITPMKSTGDTAKPYTNAIQIHLYGGREPFNTQKAAKLANKRKRS